MTSAKLPKNARSRPPRSKPNMAKGQDGSLLSRFSQLTRHHGRNRLCAGLETKGVCQCHWSNTSGYWNGRENSSENCRPMKFHLKQQQSWNDFKSIPNRGSPWFSVSENTFGLQQACPKANSVSARNANEDESLQAFPDQSRLLPTQPRKAGILPQTLNA